jgi:integrase
MSGEADPSCWLLVDGRDLRCAAGEHCGYDIGSCWSCLVRQVGAFLVAVVGRGQVEDLAAAAGEWSTLIYLLAYGGPRWGEAVALRRSRCDLLRSRLHITESASEAGGRLVFGPTKTYDDRTIIVPGFLRSLLAEHLATQTGPEESALVFTAREGGPLRHANFYKRVWRPAKQAAGVPEDLRIHDLRHTCAALLIAQGASPKRSRRTSAIHRFRSLSTATGTCFPRISRTSPPDSTRHVKSVARTKRVPGVVELPTERPETAL